MDTILEIIIVDRPVVNELVFRASDKPNVASWDTTPGREGFIVRGSQAGEVILWAQHQNTPAWIAVPVINTLQ